MYLRQYPRKDLIRVTIPERHELESPMESFLVKSNKID